MTHWRDEFVDAEDIRMRVRFAGEDLPGRPVLVLVGGAGGLADAQQRVQPFFDRVLVPLIGKTQGIVVDGGTDAGIMRLIGHASRRTDVPVDLVGVAAAGTVQLVNATPMDLVWPLTRWPRATRNARSSPRSDRS